MPVPLVFLFGPSGAGKSTLCGALSRQLGWLRIETDPYSANQDRAAKRVLEGVRRALSMGGQFADLAADLQQMAGASFPGVVVSFVSMDSPSIEDIRALRARGIFTFYQFGTEDECLRAFLDREGRTGRKLPASHWHTHNALIYNHCREPAYQPYKLHAFECGARRPVRDLVAELQARIGA